MENNDNSDSCKEKINRRRQKSAIATNKQKMKKGRSNQEKKETKENDG